MPYVFTEQGIAMLSGILNSPIAIKVNIQIMRTFVYIRKLMLEKEDVRPRLKSLEELYTLKFKNVDQQIKVIFEALNHVLYPPEKTKKFGFDPRNAPEK